MSLPKVEERYVSQILESSPPIEFFVHNELGVQELQTRVRLQDKDKNKLKWNDAAYPDPNFLYHLYLIADGIDREMNANMETLVKDRIFRTKFSKEEVAGIQDRYLNKLRTIDSSAEQIGIGQNIMYAFPLYGSAPIMDQVANTKAIERKKLKTVEIGGTSGMSTGNAEVQSVINPELLNKENYVVFCDDVSDTSVTAIRLAIARRLYRMGLESLPEDDDYAELIAKIDDLRRGDYTFDSRELEEQYAIASQLFYEEKVIIAPLFAKNSPLVSFLNSEAYEVQNYDDAYKNWGFLQIIGTNPKDTQLIGEKEWIMGGMGRWGEKYNLLDTGFDGWEHEIRKQTDFAGIMNFIKPEYREFLMEKGLDKLYLRIGGGIEDLVVLDPGRFNDLAKMTADWINAYMERAFSS